MSNAFAPIVRARPNPIFGRPVHQGSPPIDYSPILLLKPFGFRIAPDTLSSDENLVGQRGITPAFGYSAPHPSAGGTLTLLIHALPSAHYDGVRLLGFVHHRLRLLAFPMRTRGVHPPAKSETSRFPCKELPHMPGSLTTPERWVLALSHLPVLPSVLSSTWASGSRTFRGSMAGLCAPLSTLRRYPREYRRMTRGPVWFAIPSLQETFTLYSLPVSPAH